MTDADPDGGHIELLLTTLFLHHLPEIVAQGKLYAVVPPLYITKTAKEKLYWKPSQTKDFKKYCRNHKNVEVTRLKGLGEMDDDDLYDTTMNPENRELIQLTTENLEETLDLYDRLMGKHPALRKEYIIKNKLSSFTEDDVYDEDIED